MNVEYNHGYAYTAKYNNVCEKRIMQQNEAIEYNHGYAYTAKYNIV